MSQREYMSPLVINFLLALRRKTRCPLDKSSRHAVIQNETHEEATLAAFSLISGYSAVISAYLAYF